MHFINYVSFFTEAKMDEFNGLNGGPISIGDEEPTANRLTRSFHTPTHIQRNIFILIIIMLFLASFYPALTISSYKGSADLHATIEMVGSLLGLIAGFAMVMRFYTLGNRFHLLIGLAFFVNGAEDLVHGFLSFDNLRDFIGMPASSLQNFIPGTYVAGRLMLCFLLLAAPFTKIWAKKSVKKKHETFWISSAVIFITIIVTAAAFKIPLPQFIYPDRFISRPVDLLSAVLLFLVLVIYLREYRHTRDMLLWWISLSIGIHIVGQVMMSFSGELYDSFFDTAHIYKVLGYAVPLLGFSLYQISVIAERHQAEKERQKLEEQLNQARKMEAIGNLAGGIAHDFNNILGVIIGFTELAIDDAPEKNKTRTHLEKVLESANRAKELVKQILTFSRKSEEKKKPVVLGEIVEEVHNLLKSTLPSTIEIRLTIEKNLDLVMANSTQLQQVLVNFCTNAAHAMREKGGIIEIDLKEVNLEPGTGNSIDTIGPSNLDLHNEGKFQQLTVRDSGHGMDEETKKRIFEPYFTTKKFGEGTGMGLALAHGIIKSHGGEITVDSEPGKGTTFHVYLPVTTKEIEPVIDEIESIQGGCERVLFVDDEPQLVEMAKEMLENLGYQVVTRTSSVEALEIFRANPTKFDIVITDQTMPHMTGIQFSMELRRLGADIPIILCTGYSESVNEENFKSHGINAFVMKPIDTKEIARVIRNVLDTVEKGR
jgi:signal transduction histidine kinase/ActR/RegA family two-component response regulator